MNDLKSPELKGKRVLYRPDYNVPVKDGMIQDDFRIVATFPTLDYLIEKGAKVIIATHFGRPEGKEMPEFELRPIAERLADQYPEHTVHLAHKIDDPEVEKAIGMMAEGDILVLPNVRFFPEEEANDEAFGKKLASLADMYVNDAFACDHRAHASIVRPPATIPGYPGLLLQKELEHLGSLLKEPSKPFIVIMGGAKVSDKIEMMELLGKMADKILIGGAMANTFLLAKGEKIGESVAEADKVDEAKKLMTTFGDKLVLAADFVPDVEGDDQEKFKYLDIGAKAIEQFKDILKDAETIFWNGSLGYTEDPKYAVASQAIAEYIAGLKGVKSIIAGGDTVEMITRLKMHDKFTFVSTGGGAALELLSGKELPGVKALEESKAAAPAASDSKMEEVAKVEEKPEEEKDGKEEMKEEKEEKMLEPEKKEEPEMKEETKEGEEPVKEEVMKEEQTEEKPAEEVKAAAITEKEEKDEKDEKPMAPAEKEEKDEKEEEEKDEKAETEEKE